MVFYYKSFSCNQSLRFAAFVLCSLYQSHLTRTHQELTSISSDLIYCMSIQARFINKISDFLLMYNGGQKFIVQLLHLVPNELKIVLWFTTTYDLGQYCMTRVKNGCYPKRKLLNFRIHLSWIVIILCGLLFILWVFFVHPRTWRTWMKINQKE